MSLEMTIQDNTLLETYDWVACESPYHHDRVDRHDGNGKYIVLYHKCVGAPAGPTIRCAPYVAGVKRLYQVWCIHCQQLMLSAEFLVVIGQVDD